MRRYWSVEEINILIAKYPNSEWDEILSLLPDRSKDSISLKARKLDLKRNNEITKIIKSRNMSGNKNPMFGKSGYNKDRKLSDETKLKISLANKGNNGLSGDKNPMYGKIPYNKGLKLADIFSDEKTKDIKNKISSGLKRKWESLSVGEKEARIIICMDQCLSKVKREYTKPELITKDIIEELGYNYVSQEKIGFYTCDFRIGNTIIEVQGDYWHSNPGIYDELNATQKKNLGRDKAKNTYYLNKGYKILYVWEYDLYRNRDFVKNLISNFLINYS